MLTETTPPDAEAARRRRPDLPLAAGSRCASRCSPPASSSSDSRRSACSCRCLPTTPFLLVAAACFARSSPRFYRALLGNRVFGPLIRDWREHRAVPLRAKMLAITAIALVLGSTIVFSVPSFRPRASDSRRSASRLCIWLWRQPTRAPELEGPDQRRSGDRRSRRARAASRRSAASRSGASCTFWFAVYASSSSAKSSTRRGTL